jgi:hypothetical protein
VTGWPQLLKAWLGTIGMIFGVGAQGIAYDKAALLRKASARMLFAGPSTSLRFAQDDPLRDKPAV